MLVTIITFILVLSILVFVHEMGHFLVAKRSGIFVEEFGLGLPPRVWFRKRGGTIYSINLLPIGGFVRLKGEDSFTKEELNAKDSFASKSPITRFKVLVAGVVLNFILGVIIITFLYTIGTPVISENVRIKSLEPNSSGLLAGLQVDDKIIQINGEPITNTSQVLGIVEENSDTEILILVERDQDNLEIKATPTPYLGVELTVIEFEKYPLYEAPYRGVVDSLSLTKELLIGVIDIFVNSVKEGKVQEGVSGPIGIAVFFGEISDLGFRFKLQFMGILSLNLALLNILPFPALDGGRILFVLIEMFTKKRVPLEYERLIHSVGMILLLLVLLLVTIKDIFTIF